MEIAEYNIVLVSAARSLSTLVELKKLGREPWGHAVTCECRGNEAQLDGTLSGLERWTLIQLVRGRRVDLTSFRNNFPIRYITDITLFKHERNYSQFKKYFEHKRIYSQF